MKNIHAHKRMAIAKQMFERTLKLGNNALQSFIVYGSTAQQTANEESDLDIQILVEFKTPEFISQTQQITAAYEEKYNIEIAINIKTISEYLELIQRKEPLYYFILSDGHCLMNSLTFKGLRHILNHEIGPDITSLRLAHSKGIDIRAENIIHRLAPSFLNDVKRIVLGHINLREIVEENLEKWPKHSIENDHSNYNSIENWRKKTIQAIWEWSPRHGDSSEPEEFDLVEILSMANEILQETS